MVNRREIRYEKMPVIVYESWSLRVPEGREALLRERRCSLYFGRNLTGTRQSASLEVTFGVSSFNDRSAFMSDQQRSILRTLEQSPDGLRAEARERSAESARHVDRDSILLISPRSCRVSLQASHSRPFCTPSPLFSSRSSPAAYKSFQNAYSLYQSLKQTSHSMSTTTAPPQTIPAHKAVETLAAKLRRR